MRLVSVVAIAVVVLAGYAVSPRGAAAQTGETRSSTGIVSFDVTPGAAAEGRFVFEIVANTHSGDLADINLMEVVALEIEGETRRPVAATALSGHHATGSVTFEVADVPAAFALTITGVRDLGTLRFEWP